MRKIRKPQPRCKCGHSRSNHSHYSLTKTSANFIETVKDVNKWFRCGYCYGKCEEFRYDALATWEKIYDFKEKKEKQA